jgi:hypothetical protein
MDNTYFRSLSITNSVNGSRALDRFLDWGASPKLPRTMPAELRPPVDDVAAHNEQVRPADNDFGNRTPLTVPANGQTARDWGADQRDQALVLNATAAEVLAADPGERPVGAAPELDMLGGSLESPGGFGWMRSLRPLVAMSIELWACYWLIQRERHRHGSSERCATGPRLTAGVD